MGYQTPCFCLKVSLGTVQVLQRLHESPNTLQAIRAVWMAKVSLQYTLCLHAWHQHRSHCSNHGRMP